MLGTGYPTGPLRGVDKITLDQLNAVFSSKRTHQRTWLFYIPDNKHNSFLTSELFCKHRISQNTLFRVMCKWSWSTNILVFNRFFIYGSDTSWILKVGFFLLFFISNSIYFRIIMDVIYLSKPIILDTAWALWWIFWIYILYLFSILSLIINFRNIVLSIHTLMRVVFF